MRRQSTSSDCISLSSGSDSQNENEFEDDHHTSTSDISVSNTKLSNNLFCQNNIMDERLINSTDQTLNNVQSLQTLIASNAIYDENYWQDLARLTYDLIVNNSKNEQNRKRSYTSILSPLSSSDEHCRYQKRVKQSPCPQDNIDMIILSSDDNTDDDDDDDHLC